MVWWTINTTNKNIMPEITDGVQGYLDGTVIADTSSMAQADSGGGPYCRYREVIYNAQSTSITVRQSKGATSTSTQQSRLKFCYIKELQ